MKKIFPFLLFFLLISVPAFAQPWQKTFYDNLRQNDYDTAVEKSLDAQISIHDIVVVSSRLGYDHTYISARVYKLAVKKIDRGEINKTLKEVLDDLFMAGIPPYIIEKATAMSDYDLASAVRSGEIYIPQSSEVAVNYQKYYGDLEEELNEALAKIDADKQEEQGLGFGDDPGLGGGDIGMGEVNFNNGGNIDVPVSPAAP